jgi:hypothetical protein
VIYLLFVVVYPYALVTFRIIASDIKECAFLFQKSLKAKERERDLAPFYFLNSNAARNQMSGFEVRGKGQLQKSAWHRGIALIQPYRTYKRGLKC